MTKNPVSNEGLNCFLIYKTEQFSRAEVNLNLETVLCDPLICTMDRPRLVISNHIEECISIVCMFDLFLNVPSTIFQLNRDESSWVEPVLS